MKNFTTSSDNTKIAYTTSGTGACTLLFVHGWLGNKDWWLGQSEVFEKDYAIARMDLAGHGESGKERKDYSGSLYADDITAVANVLNAEKLILVGHSMSGAYVLEAAIKVKNLKGIIIVDTLKDLESEMPAEMLAGIFHLYRTNFKNAVENIIPQYLFSTATPAEIRARLQAEFLTNTGDFAAKALEPLYKVDVRSFAKQVTVPVIAINSVFGPENKQNNQKFFKDYDVYSIEGTGHYPMLENVSAFNSHFKTALTKILPNRPF